MIGKIFITSKGYDPQLGKHVNDPYLGPEASLGACRPDFRRQVKKGDHLFVISGKLPNVRQFGDRRLRSCAKDRRCTSIRAIS